MKYWSTFNEPNIFIPEGYNTGKYPPGRCSAPSGICRSGNSSTEPYIAAHNVLRAHASAVRLYRTLYQVLFKELLTRADSQKLMLWRIWRNLFLCKCAIKLISLITDPKNVWRTGKAGVNPGGGRGYVVSRKKGIW